MSAETIRDPETMPVVISIYEEGREAKKAGKSVLDCPYINPRNVHSWVTGWKHQAEGKRIADTFGDLLKSKG